LIGVFRKLCGNRQYQDEKRPGDPAKASSQILLPR
jgi:hypothetical protein